MKLLLFILLSPLMAMTIIAHRGASGHLPEHSLAAYLVAHAQGADWIELDVVMTKDKRIIALHDITLQRMTNVARRFPHKANQGDFFASDFNLDEIKKLYLKQDLSYYPKRYNGPQVFQVPTLEETLATIGSFNRTTGKSVGLYIEVKSPSYHQKKGLDLCQALDKALAKQQLFPANKIIIESFEHACLQKMKGKWTRVALFGSEWFSLDEPGKKAYLKRVRSYAQGIGIHWEHLKDPLLAGKIKGLFRHVYTFRLDKLPKGKSLQQTTDWLKTSSVEGVFTDFPLETREILRLF